MVTAFQLGLDPLAEHPDLTVAGNLFYKLNGEVPPTWKIRMMDTILILYADHEFNASTFAARVTASTLADMYAAVTSACGTLKGPLHGGANEESMKMLDDIKTADRAEKWMMDALAKKAKIMGFGHRVYKKGDSRVPIMRDIARDLGQRVGKEDWVPICETARGHDGAREAPLRQRRSLRRAGLHDARVPAGLEHAHFCRLARRRLVRARHRAARQQSLDSSALVLRRTTRTAVSWDSIERQEVALSCSGGL